MKVNTCHIYFIKLEEILPDETFMQFLSMLPEQMQSEINAYKHRESAQASLLGKMVLLLAIRKLGLKFSLSDIQVGHKDRLFVNEEIDFNISHSGAYVILAITKNGKVGVDIEKHRKVEVALFRKYFDDDEWNEIETSEDQQRTFFDLWSVKESAIKCDGRGVEILSKTHKDPSAVNMIICDGHHFYFQQLPLDNDYACCVCSDKMTAIKLEYLTISELNAYK